MIKFLASLPTYAQDGASKIVLQKIQSYFEHEDGICYYKHPVLRLETGVTAELTFLTKSTDPIAVRCLPHQIDDIQDVNEKTWVINDEEEESPLLELDDFIIVLRTRFDKDRALRGRLAPKAVLALPQITQSEFKQKFGDILDDHRVLWKTDNISSLDAALSSPLDEALSGDEWIRARAIFQGATPLTKSASGGVLKSVTTMGPAIKQLDREIALLDVEQEKAALQIAPGPQCIRGLAGTGKTVLLAMKAANIHLHYPEKRILFTFHTQSLYNQAKMLITKFYRFYSDVDPDWDLLHIRHSWGGRRREGVYSDLCYRHGLQPLTFDEAKSRKVPTPFQACCEHALQVEIQPFYDFILVDEAQDFPKDFFRILYQLAYSEKQIYWAYDELQNLSAAPDIPKAEELFGYDESGHPLVTLEGGDYPGDIEKELILRKSYRCAQPVLMVAHAIGLGLYNQRGGCVQMLNSEASWEAIGYSLERGNLEKGKDVVLYRPAENSPNRISTIYHGPEKLVTVEVFDERNHELDWIAHKINQDIQQGVQPEQIIVIYLDARVARDPLSSLQVKLLTKYNIPTTIPGLINDASEYMQKGMVTLSAVFRAKGNEAYVVYVCGFESLYDYVEAIENRNRAFTAITRSKAWVRITGVGRRMEAAKQEVDLILASIPRFRFTFPDMAVIRRLDAETSKRRQAVAKTETRVSELAELDPKVLASIDPKKLDLLIKRIQEAKDENK